MREAALSSLTLTHELSESAANKQTNLVFRGSASAKSALSLRRKAACRSKNLQAAFR